MSFRLASRVKTVAFDHNTAATFKVVDKLPRRVIRVVAYDLKAVAANTVTWKSGTTALSGATPATAAERLQLAGSAESPLIQCAVNEDLNITLGSAQQLVGWISYTQETI